MGIPSRPSRLIPLALIGGLALAECDVVLGLGGAGAIRAQSQGSMNLRLRRGSEGMELVIERYEPSAAAPGLANPSEQGANNQNEQDQDKVQAPPEMKGYEKTAVLLQVRGPYEGVLGFLRAMEKLELLVQPSDLELKAVPPEANAEGLPAGPPLTELKLRLSFFDKTTAGDQDANKPVESDPQSRARAPS